ncbi:MAG: hypothetical protein LLG00_13705 [Planctomycetaceae bacterium]|nr:hypothetical protein [Planctomycetaceae bacterium]
MDSRRAFLGKMAATAAAMVAQQTEGGLPRDKEALPSADSRKRRKRVPVIDTTDLYHPHQDPGDNVDLVAAYALPEIDLRAVVLDATEKYRQPPEGPRDSGFIPVIQLNSIFDRNVPCATTPYAKMKSPDDKMLDAPKFQQAGIELILETLRKSPDKIEILVFGSAKSVAAALNREPALVHTKTRRIHLSAGASSLGCHEWNVALDPNAIVRLLRSELPVAIYPCATKDGPFAYGRNNSFWKLPDLKFIARMEPKLRRYLVYAMSRNSRVDFLRAMEEDPPADVLATVTSRPHNVWETAVWMQVADRRLVRRVDGRRRIIPAEEVLPTDRVLPNDLRPCRVTVHDTGDYEFELTEGTTNFWIYDRGDPKANEAALREALPNLYESFRP